MTDNSKKRYIFLVDDDEEDREMFSEALLHVNKEINLTELPSGFKLIEALKNPEFPKPEIIFLDLNMPKLNGIDCLKKIKSTSEFKDLKVVILSTYSNEDEIEEAYQYGASHYYIKPTIFDNLKNLISRALKLENNTKNFRTKKRIF